MISISCSLLLALTLVEVSTQRTTQDMLIHGNRVPGLRISDAGPTRVYCLVVYSYAAREHAGIVSDPKALLLLWLIRSWMITFSRLGHCWGRVILNSCMGLSSWHGADFSRGGRSWWRAINTCRRCWRQFDGAHRFRGLKLPQQLLVSPA